MSVNFKEHRRFISMLLNGDKSLAKNLLFNANSRELSVLAELFYNLNILPLSQEKRKQIRNYKPIFKRYVNNPKERKILARKHYKIIKNTLDLVSSFILEILE